MLMLSTNNILSPANGKPIAVPSQDMVIGAYYLTFHAQDDLSNVKPEDLPEMPQAFSNYEEVIQAYEQRLLDQRQVPVQRSAGVAEFTRKAIRLRLPDGSRVVTTVGRAIFNMESRTGCASCSKTTSTPASYTYPQRQRHQEGRSPPSSTSSWPLRRHQGRPPARRVQGGRFPLRHARRGDRLQERRRDPRESARPRS